MNCSFSKLTGTECASISDKIGLPQETIPLKSCTKDVSGHLKTVSVSELSSELELILARAGIFYFDDEFVSSMTICPRHRHQLGGGWFKKNKCRFPDHSGNAKPTRTIDKTQSRLMFEKFGILVPVGSGICTSCRKSMPRENTCASSSMENKTDRIITRERKLRVRLSVLDESSPSLDVSYMGSPEVQPFQCSAKDSTLETNPDHLSEINALLRSRDYSPVRYSLKTKWSVASNRTRREHIRKAEQGVQAILHSIAPGQEDEVLKDLLGKLAMEQTREGKSEESIQAFAEAYSLAEDKATKEQILSIIIDKFTYKEIQNWLPEVSKYRLEQAKRHLLLHGRGQRPPEVKTYRTALTLPKVDHFIEFISSPHFIQDVAYGTRKLKLSSGEIIRMPNVVRNVISSRVIKQYIAYCKEIGFDCLGERELYKVLESCPAQQRKALQGLDNTSADGTQGIEKLENIIRILGERGNGSLWVTKWIDCLSKYKRYLKYSYRLNVSMSSRCANHCSVFSLSDPDNTEYSGKCDHDHDMECIECGKLEEIEGAIKSSFHSPDVTFYSNDEKEDLIHDLDVCLDAIRAWKCHLLRAVHQDKSRNDALETWLKDSSRIFITQDFAMKFLPRRFKEAQVDWFGKRGISWHISYCVRKLEQDQAYEVTVYSHVFRETISQNSEIVASVMRHTLTEEKKKHQELQQAYYRSDCAGAYASGNLLIPIRHMKELTGIEVSRYDFSEPQAGKGPCDRSSAHQKFHVNAFLNEGNDVMTATDIKDALNSHGGVQGVVPFVVESAPCSNLAIPKIPGISLLHNFEYSDEGVRVWKAYMIGSGNLLTWNVLDPGGNCHPQSLSVSANEDCCGDKSYKFKIAEEKEEFIREAAEAEESDSELDRPAIFTCPHPGCTKEYITLGGLDRHLSTGSHNIQSPNEPLRDSIKRKWANVFESTQRCDVPPIEEFSKLQISDDSTSSLQGWALKKTKQSARFSDKIRKYLEDIFHVGSQTGHKLDPLQVASDMRSLRDEHGVRFFTATECLHPQQIRNFFSRMAASKKRQGSEISVESEVDIERNLQDIAALEDQLNIADACSVVMRNTMEKHPVTFERYNLCELYDEGKLKTKFSIAMLLRVCEQLQLDSSCLPKSRKAALVDKIEQVLKRCACRS